MNVLTNTLDTVRDLIVDVSWRLQDAPRILLLLPLALALAGIGLFVAGLVEEDPALSVRSHTLQGVVAAGSPQAPPVAPPASAFGSTTFEGAPEGCKTLARRANDLMLQGRFSPDPAAQELTQQAAGTCDSERSSVIALALDPAGPREPLPVS